MTSCYGDRDGVRFGQEVVAPDGRTFVQGDTSTYLEVPLERVDRPEGYRQDYGPRPLPAAAPTHGERVSGKILSPSHPEDYHGFRILERVVSDCNLFWHITYADPNGGYHEIRRLKSSREGHG